MDVLIYYLIGWLIFSVCVYLYNVYRDDCKESKKLWVWRSFWYGICSWAGIILWLAIFIVFIVFEINDWVEEKLK